MRKNVRKPLQARRRKRSARPFSRPDQCQEREE
jgi:hypothetical protein